MSKLASALVAALGAATVALAPIAGADPDLDTQSARATIDELQAQGYDVQINWMNGARRESLSDCSVTAVHNPNRSGEPPTTFTTVYIDVLCQEHHDDDGGLFWGVGGVFF